MNMKSGAIIWIIISITGFIFIGDKTGIIYEVIQVICWLMFTIAAFYLIRRMWFKSEVAHHVSSMGREGNIGGVARWAGNNYIAYIAKGAAEEEKKELNNKKGFIKVNKHIFKGMIKARFVPLPNKEQEKYLISRINSGKIFCLLDLCIEILKVEAAFHKNSYEIVDDWLDVMHSELINLGVDKKAILGWDLKDIRHSSRTKQLLTPPESALHKDWSDSVE